MEKKKIAVVTDSNSGITLKEAESLGVFVLPMPFYINEELFFEEITLTHEEFYKRLEENADISTSQPSPADVYDIWKKALETADEVVYIPMSSGLSKSLETAVMLARDFEGYEGKVHVVDNKRISVTQRQSVMDALELAEMGLTGEEIKEILERCSMESTIYITVETLKYLKKGGRVTPTAAALGTVFNIKPVLQIQGERLDAYAKARGMKRACGIMIDAIKKDLETRFKDIPFEKMVFALAYSGAYNDEVKKWKEEVEAAFPGIKLLVNPLSLSVSCHIGPGALAITATAPVHMK
ncbi:MAG: DegV family protein [Lachnospiraceae bacterium]|nr:DegV family protein [Lachnospiraceae bacterium]